MSFERVGPRVDEDEALVELLATDADSDINVDSVLVVAAACHNMLAWTADLTLNTTIVIATDPHYARVGEIVESGDFATASVEDIEASLLAGGSREGPVNDEERSRYLTLRREDASEKSRSRFVAYVTNVTTTDQKFVLLDLDAFHPSSARFTAFQAGTMQVIVAGVGPTAVDADDCEEFVSQE